ncbi:hypothetical protein ACMHYB_30345 [Sorangium sp. So ce1128]
MSAEKFARREGYKPKQLYWWRWKLRAEGPSQPAPLRSTEAPRFLPVHVVADAAPSNASPSSRRRSPRSAWRSRR